MRHAGLAEQPGPDWRRRAMLRAAVWGLLGGLAGACDRPPGDADTGRSGTPAWLSDVTGEPDAVRRLGRSYLQQVPAEGDPASLLQIISNALLAHQRIAPEASSPRMTAHAIRQEVQDDFRLARVVQVDGWILSLTEARLYALVSLLDS